MISTKSITSHLEIIPSITEQTKETMLLMTFMIGLSLLSGPVLFVIYCMTNGAFEDGQKFLALFVFIVMGFELTWVVYGLVTWIRGAFHISDEYSDIIA